MIKCGAVEQIKFSWVDFELMLQWLKALEMEWDECSLHIWRIWVLGIQRADYGRRYNASQQCLCSNSQNLGMCWKRPWCWERLKAGGEGDDRGWDGWMASPTRWTWVWVNSRSWWWTGRPGVLQSMGSQRVGYNWVTELNSEICYLLDRRDFADVVKWIVWVGEIILDYLGGLNGSLESKNFSRLETEEDVIMKNIQRDTMLWALKIGEGGCEPANVNWKTSKSWKNKERHRIDTLLLTQWDLCQPYNLQKFQRITLLFWVTKYAIIC